MSKSSKKRTHGNIYIGVGGWTSRAVARGVLSGEAGAGEGAGYAASKLTSIEINGTYYGSQKPESFRKWAARCRTVRVFGQRSALCHQPAGAGGGRQLHKAVL